MAQHGADGVQTPGRSTRVSVRPRRPVRHHWVGGQARGVMGMQPLHISSQSGLEYGRVSLLVPAGHAQTIPQSCSASPHNLQAPRETQPMARRVTLQRACLAASSGEHGSSTDCP